MKISLGIVLAITTVFIITAGVFFSKYRFVNYPLEINENQESYRYSRIVALREQIHDEDRRDREIFSVCLDAVSQQRIYTRSYVSTYEGSSEYYDKNGEFFGSFWGDDSSQPEIIGQQPQFDDRYVCVDVPEWFFRIKIPVNPVVTY